MIKNLWKNVTLCCGCHDKNIEMELTLKGATMYYSCSECNNRIKADDFQEAVEYVGEEIEKSKRENIQSDFEGMKWTKKSIEYQVIHYDESQGIQIKISVINKKEALR